MKRRYLTRAERLAMLKRQDFLCAICHELHAQEQACEDEELLAPGFRIARVGVRELPPRRRKA